MDQFIRKSREEIQLYFEQASLIGVFLVLAATTALRRHKATNNARNALKS
jgi:hypothetical protein